MIDVICTATVMVHMLENYVRSEWRQFRRTGIIVAAVPLALPPNRKRRWMLAINETNAERVLNRRFTQPRLPSWPPLYTTYLDTCLFLEPRQ